MEYRLGIDLGGTGIKAGIVDCNGIILSKKSSPTNSGRDFSQIVKDIAATAISVMNDCNIQVKDIVNIGMGSPGIIDSRKGTVMYSNNIKWKDMPLALELEKLVGKKVNITNDAKAAALGEALFGAGKHFDNIVLLTLGTGVGGGIIINKRVYEGKNNAGGILGHIAIELDGRECTCGRKGCLEAYASATALISDAKAALCKYVGKTILKAEDLNAENIFNAAKNGDLLAEKLVNNYISYLGEGVTSIVNMLRPDAIILGGGVSNAGDFLTNRVQEYAMQRVFGKELITCSVTRSVLGSDSGIIGAAFVD